MTGPHHFTDAAEAAAADAVLWSLAEFDPSLGAWDDFVRAAARGFVARAVLHESGKKSPGPLLEDNFPAPAVPPPLDWLGLLTPHPHLQSAVSLVCVDGHTLTSAGHRLGLKHDAVKKRLGKAVAFLRGEAIPLGTPRNAPMPAKIDSLVETIEGELSAVQAGIAKVRHRLPAIASAPGRTKARILAELVRAAVAAERVQELLPTAAAAKR